MTLKLDLIYCWVAAGGHYTVNEKQLDVQDVLNNRRVGMFITVGLP